MVKSHYKNITPPPPFSVQIPHIKKAPSHLSNRSLGAALSWATWIRTRKMTESESVALPFGDSPSTQRNVLYNTFFVFASPFLIFFNFIRPPMHAFSRRMSESLHLFHQITQYLPQTLHGTIVLGQFRRQRQV